MWFSQSVRLKERFPNQQVNFHLYWYVIPVSKMALSSVDALTYQKGKIRTNLLCELQRIALHAL